MNDSHAKAPKAPDPSEFVELVDGLLDEIAAMPRRGTFTDPRDGRAYKTVRIGRQTWLAENLAFDCEGSKIYGNKLENLAKYGRLYDWDTAKKAVPPGWHLPTNEEWGELADFAGGRETAGRKLKAERGWNKGGSGTDEFGFAALPGGYGISNGDFDNAGDYGYWWSATESNSYIAYSRDMGYDYEYVSYYNSAKSYLHSVRCLRDGGGTE